MVSDTSSEVPASTVDDDTLDSLVQAASIPSLASLIQRGKDAGLIKPVQGYDGTGEGLKPEPPF